MSMPSPQRAAFTLIEAVLVAATVGLLAALLLPNLAGARAGALRTKTLAHLHQSASIIHAYADDWKDSFPAFADPRAASTTIHTGGGESVTIDWYFSSCMQWNWALCDSYLGGVLRPAYIYDAEQVARAGSTGGTPFMLSCTTFARPEFWHNTTRIGPEQWGATFRHDVRFPADKAMLVSIYPEIAWSRGRPRGAPRPPTLAYPTAFMDAHATDSKLADFAPGYMSGEGGFPGSMHGADFFVGLHTLGGVRGRDLP